MNEIKKSSDEDSSQTSAATSNATTSTNDTSTTSNKDLNTSNMSSNAPTPATLGTGNNLNNARKTTNFQQIRINIKCARLTPLSGIFNNKAALYAEIITDGNPSRKTEIVRKSWSPQWNENFDILVTPTSRIEFRVFNYQTFKSDTLVGQCLIFVNKLSQDTSNFNFRNLEKTFDLCVDHKGKTGVVEVVFNGIDANSLRIGLLDILRFSRNNHSTNYKFFFANKRFQ